MRTDRPDSRKRQILLGSLVIAAVGLFLILLWLGRHIPGVVGEWFGLVVGVATSPFLMPVCFVLLGFFVVNTLNAWRRHREGEECVYLESVEGPGSEALREQARHVIYDQPPLQSGDPDAIRRLEGALAISDYESALEVLSEMQKDLRDSPQVLEMRIQLAVATDKPELAARLRRQLSDAG